MTLTKGQRKRMRKLHDTLGKDDPGFYRDVVDVLADGYDLLHVILAAYTTGVARGRDTAPIPPGEVLH